MEIGFGKWKLEIRNGNGMVEIGMAPTGHDSFREENGSPPETGGLGMRLDNTRINAS